MVNAVKTALSQEGLDVVALRSGLDMLKQERLDSFEKFSAGIVKTAVTSNLASRGINIEAVRLVIAFNVPLQTKPILYRTTRGGQFDRKTATVHLIDTLADLKRLREHAANFKIETINKIKLDAEV